MCICSENGPGRAAVTSAKSRTSTDFALTANAMQGDRERCFAVGCNDFISKPIDAAQLLDAIRRLLPRK